MTDVLDRSPTDTALEAASIAAGANPPRAAIAVGAANARSVTTLPAPAVEPVLEPRECADSFDASGFCRELDQLRAETLADLGQPDADYIHRLIRLQRRLELGGRTALVAGILPPAWVAGTLMLSLSKIIENMEIGHNVMHGQWDWMCDPAVHSTTWEWDNVCPSRQWKHSHNVRHHQWTNVRELDGDIGYGLLRVDPDQAWHPAYLAQPLVFVMLALIFEYGIGLHDISIRSSTKFADARAQLVETARKVRSQVLKDYVAFPALALPFGFPSAVAAAAGALTANLARNIWSFSVIFCGHFPDGVTYFDQAEVENESRGSWYRRQVLGSANFTGGPLLNPISGNLNYQIEHHLFPDLPSNRYAAIAPRVREICDRYGVEYHTGSFARQFGSVIRKVLRLALPGRPRH